MTKRAPVRRQFAVRRQPIEDDTREIGIGPINFNVERARNLGGMSLGECRECYEQMRTAYLDLARRIARRHGRTARCEVCECWTTPGGCMHCKAGHFVPYPVAS